MDNVIITGRRCWPGLVLTNFYDIFSVTKLSAFCWVSCSCCKNVTDIHIRRDDDDNGKEIESERYMNNKISFFSNLMTQVTKHTCKQVLIFLLIYQLTMRCSTFFYDTTTTVGHTHEYYKETVRNLFNWDSKRILLFAMHILSSAYTNFDEIVGRRWKIYD